MNLTEMFPQRPSGNCGAGWSFRIPRDGNKELHFVYLCINQLDPNPDTQSLRQTHLSGGRVYFGSQYQKVSAMVTWSFFSGRVVHRMLWHRACDTAKLLAS